MTIENAGNTVRPPRRTMLAWAFLLPLLFLVAVVLQSRYSPQAPVQSLLLPSDEQPVPHSKANTETKPAIAQQPTVSTTLFVPDSDDKLQRKVFTTRPPQPVKTDPESIANRTMNLFLKQNVRLYPVGTKLLSPVRLVAGAWQIDFNRNFADEKFWSSELQAQIAVTALVNTMASVSPDPKGAAPAKVRLYVEGKPVSTVGQWDTGGDMDADPTMVDQP